MNASKPYNMKPMILPGTILLKYQPPIEYKMESNNIIQQVSPKVMYPPCASGWYTLFHWIPGSRSSNNNNFKRSKLNQYSIKDHKLTTNQPFCVFKHWQKKKKKNVGNNSNPNE